MATKKGLCPRGQVPDGKGGCKQVLPTKPAPKASVETAEEKAERIAKEKEAAKKAEEARIGNLSNREFRKETKNADRVVELANRKAGKETTSRGGRILKKIGAGVTSALAATFSGLEIAEKIKDLKKEKNGGAINNKLKTIGTMKTKCMSCGGTTKKMQDGGYVKTPGKTGARASISKTTKTMSGGTKTKTISGGPLVPNAKGSITITKTNADGSLNKTSTKSISGKRASNKISKYQDGGFPITARAAARKVAKGKGMMDYKYPSTDAPGTGDNKGSYVKFGKDQGSSPSGFKSLKGAGKSRPVRKMGGATKKKK